MCILTKNVLRSINPNTWLNFWPFLELMGWKIMKTLCHSNTWYIYGNTTVYYREGIGTPLQDSCLENPRDGGAWWAAIYGVAQSRTRLKWQHQQQQYTTVYGNTTVFLNFCLVYLYLIIYLYIHSFTKYFGGIIPVTNFWHPSISSSLCSLQKKILGLVHLGFKVKFCFLPAAWTWTS